MIQEILHEISLSEKLWRCSRATVPIRIQNNAPMEPSEQIIFKSKGRGKESVSQMDSYLDTSDSTPRTETLVERQGTNVKILLLSQ
jgi:hypothetical protein